MHTGAKIKNFGGVSCGLMKKGKAWKPENTIPAVKAKRADGLLPSGQYNPSVHVLTFSSLLRFLLANLRTN